MLQRCAISSHIEVSGSSQAPIVFMQQCGNDSDLHMFVLRITICRKAYCTGRHVLGPSCSTRNLQVSPAGRQGGHGPGFHCLAQKNHQKWCVQRTTVIYLMQLMQFTVSLL